MAMQLEHTEVPGLLVLRMPVHRDTRGWFQEAWQREKMTALGLPDFGPVQHNVSHNAVRGSTRGIHAEPWDKLVTVVHGAVFGAWVDLREGETFGATFTTEIAPGTAVFVPRGVGNSYQALTDGAVYSYLVNAHWRPDLTYTALALDDPTAAIDWPIPLSQAEISPKDQANPTLEGVTPFARRRPLILGGSGQIGSALRALLPDALAPTRAELDLTDRAAVAALALGEHDLVINAAAMTAVDAAESDEGRRLAWRLNAELPTQLARRAASERFTLVHYSTDYVFDGQTEVHDEDEALAPLSVYGQSKAAGDLAVTLAPRHYLLRTAWVVGDGANFVRTMARLADEGGTPAVVDDQHGRISLASEIAAATLHLVERSASFGTYNVTQAGEPLTWAGVAREVFALRGRSREGVTGISTQEYGAPAPRPRHSTLSLDRLRQTGFQPVDQVEALRRYVASGLAPGDAHAPATDSGV
ncbi:bifunctional dTDP-4-dehydrorhamnose 3,5-epimerase family protein/NAD(P)-dependent oxidoreductase [Janibacter cremeus]|uniref:bifunctional dTDP-4-dehydrorhamnose 3,5-epimerase family protein/NAD(P)-dependent oxidoreductase n=1 Tax=Janibacter cremeus TaxID=1285192 RepID=UPI0023F75AA8|nr:bifunctional dTDP-4-dehydrorhamnose 3,5-epimerase family protein/NAD(P)-dependent oxidoreductase [Janibacter cremeus]WEV78229.1 bifunctional dTDP-4-dehydrorhamnose 3,5-epimerase family protein/NAD(P)-dependent oxidoreductase [Janibacter cremeus]WEV78309.1 bifunctional dTDP-4-dehydrorhamnose 3,5-epimerase family protein/NAD(P)-dependent oxidoreductase [Janibacter cremeus]